MHIDTLHTTSHNTAEPSALMLMPDAVTWVEKPPVIPERHYYVSDDVDPIRTDKETHPLPTEAYIGTIACHETLDVFDVEGALRELNRSYLEGCGPVNISVLEHIASQPIELPAFEKSLAEAAEQKIVELLRTDSDMVGSGLNANFMSHADQPERVAFLDKSFNDSEISLPMLCELAKLIDTIPEHDQLRFRQRISDEVKRNLDKHVSNGEVSPTAIACIPHAVDADRATFIRQIIDNANVPAYRAAMAIAAIPSANTTETAGLILGVINSPKLKPLSIYQAIKFIPQVSNDAEREHLQQCARDYIVEILDSERNERYEKRNVINGIAFMSEADRGDLILKAIEHTGDDDQMYFAVLDATTSATKEDQARLRPHIGELLKKQIAKLHEYPISKACIENALPLVSEEDQEYVRSAISNYLFQKMAESIHWVDVPPIILLLLPFASQGDQQLLRNSVQARMNVLELTKSPLHDEADNRYVRTFEKTGSKTYILPADDEASVREIPIQSANAWHRAFNNWPEWYKRGFNYVPVEPIQSVHPTASRGEVAVVTTNLRGKSFAEAKFMYPKHTVQLTQMRDTILSALDDMKIVHGHPHGNNFVVVPYLNEAGDIDFDRCPRLYVIDFDAALTGTEKNSAF